MNKRKYIKHGKDINHPDFPHGEFAGYRAGCLCEACNTANNDKKRKAYQKGHPKVAKVTKVCKSCKEEKLLLDFYLHSGDKWPEPNCIACTKIIKRKARLLKVYGLSTEQFEELLKKQNNHCDICKEPFTENNGPCIDHCHKTGIIRGLLHSTCNQGLGMYSDDPKILRNAADYLERTRFNDYSARKYTSSEVEAPSLLLIQ